MRDVQKVSSSELLTKQAMRKEIVLYTNNMYIRKLLLNVLTAGIEALLSGNEFSYQSRLLPVSSTKF
jgi:hypothetical protein